METLVLKPEIALKNILFATDFEATAKRALPFALMFAERYGAKLYAAHVVPLAAYAFPRYEAMETILKETRDYASYALRQLVDPLRRHNQPCDTLVSEGEVAEELATFAREYSADLIVVGTSSRSGLNKVFLGSVAEEIIRDAACPVLTVGPHVGPEMHARVESIVCAFDFSQGSSVAARFALSLAHDFQAHLAVVHVFDGVLKESSHLAFQLSEDRMREVISLQGELKFEPLLLVEAGPVAERILHVAAEYEADLIVMGVRGAGAFAHTASHFGSIAHKVISSATCPVLTVATEQRQ